MVCVEIRLGKHTMTIPKGIDVLIAEFLQQFVPAGNYVAHLGKNIRGSRHKKRTVKAIRVCPEGNVIILAAQPNGNGTRFECHVILENQDVQNIFTQMKQFENREGEIIQMSGVELESGSASAENIMSSMETVNIQDGKTGMEGNEIDGAVVEKGRLQVKQILSDPDTLQIILMTLSEQQEKAGHVDSTACNKLLRTNCLLGAGYSAKAVSRIFIALTRMGYLNVSEIKRGYVISDKGRELLTASPMETPITQTLVNKSVVKQVSSEIEKNKQIRIDLINVLAKAEEVSKSASASVVEAENRLVELREFKRQAEDIVTDIKTKLTVNLDS